MAGHAYFGAEKSKIKHIQFENQKIKHVYYYSSGNFVPVWSGGGVVTYHVNGGQTYTEERDEGDNVLIPKSFTPTLSGWTFVGWRSDATASSSVLSSKTMVDSPISLYAVFSKNITLSYSGNGATGGSTASETKPRYYNNGNYSSAPLFTIKANGFSRTSYTFYRWRTGTASGTIYSVGQNIALTSNMTLYAYWTPNTLTVFNGSFAPNVSKTYNISEWKDPEARDGQVTAHGYIYISSSANHGDDGASFARNTTTLNLSAIPNIGIYNKISFVCSGEWSASESAGGRANWDISVGGKTYSLVQYINASASHPETGSWNSGTVTLTGLSNIGNMSIQITNRNGSAVTDVTARVTNIVLSV